jgi:hypothetical protein
MHPRRSKANQTGTPGNKPVGITDLKPHFVFDMITSPLACGQNPSPSSTCWKSFQTLTNYYD